MKKRFTRLFTGLITVVFVLAATPIIFAIDYKVELAIPRGKQTDAVLQFKNKDFEIMPYKKKFINDGKTFLFSDITAANYSFAKKPMLSVGGATIALVVANVFAIPFLFMKKRKHWMTVQTKNEFVVIKLKGSNYRQIIAEFETHGVTVNQ